MQHTIGYLSGEFVVDQVFNSKFDLQEAANIYSIKAHHVTPLPPPGRR